MVDDIVEELVSERLGNTMRLEIQFKDFNNNAVEPTTPSVKFYDSVDNLIYQGTPTGTATGVYIVDIAVTTANGFVGNTNYRLNITATIGTNPMSNDLRFRCKKLMP